MDDGIARGHGGTLYSLPLRDLIGDSVEWSICFVKTAVVDASILSFTGPAVIVESQEWTPSLAAAYIRATQS